MKRFLPDIDLIDGEVWMPVKGYEGRYEVSNLGRVKAVYIGRAYNKPRILKADTRPTGYERVTLCKEHSDEKYFSVHRLVAMTFIPNPENKPNVNHKNLIRNDNRVENLEWATQKENVRHAMDVGANKCVGETNGFAKLTTEQVVEIFNGKLSLNKTAKQFGVSKKSVLNIRQKKSWVHATANL